MSPSNKELQLCRNCKLYTYLLTAQGKEIPDDIQNCVDSYDFVIECAAELSAELQSLDTDTFERIVKNKESSEARSLDYWWEMYQEANTLGNNLTRTCL